MHDVVKTFTRCALCPGVCVTYCPIYMNTHIRASAPNNLARLGLKYLKGYESYDPALWLCTGCRECEYNCPISNPLWNAARISRGKKSRVEAVKVETKNLGGRGSSLLVVSSIIPDQALVEYLKQFYSIHWLDTGSIYMAYWSGSEVQLNLDAFDYIIIDDLDVTPALIPGKLKGKVIYSIQLLEMMGYRSILENKAFVLHVPCKISVDGKELLINVSYKVLGKPIRTISKCIGGGGGLPEKHPVIASELVHSAMKGSRKDYLVVTLCSRAKTHLLSSGYQAKTPLDFIAGDMN
ncbi:MAG: (Fe-S)-binding protein [Desulfurococcales archaeon]|nr:(Fe-S)-binding protein [Desulfurococcales archaeon]